MNCSDHDAAALARGSGLTHGTSDNRASEKSPAEVQKKMVAQKTPNPNHSPFAQPSETQAFAEDT